MSNKEQVPKEHFQRVQKKIENLTVTELSQESMRSEIRRTALEKTFEEQGTLNRAVRAWNIECLWCENLGEMARFDQAGNGDAGGSRERRKHDEILQSEGDQQGENNLARGKATRLGQC